MSSTGSYTSIESINLTEFSDSNDISLEDLQISLSEDTSSFHSSFYYDDDAPFEILDEAALFEGEDSLLTFHNIPFVYEEIDTETILSNKTNLSPVISSPPAMRIFSDMYQSLKRLDYVGIYSAIDVRDNLLIVGTSRGNLLGFDIHQGTSFILLNPLEDEFRCVNHVAISPNKLYVAAVSNNLFLIWKVSNHKTPLVQVRLQKHDYIVNVAFGNNSKIGFLVNNRNEGYSFNTKNDSLTKLFKSKSNIPSSFVPLILPSSWDDIVHRDYTITAVTLRRRIIFLSFKPRVKIIHKIEMKSEGQPFLIAWHVPASSDSYTIKFACSNTSNIVTYSSNYVPGTPLDEIVFTPEASFKTDKIVYISFMSDSVIYVLTSFEKINLINADNGQVLETYSISNNNLATSSRVSNEGELVSLYQNCIRTHENYIYVVCSKDIIVYRARTFQERIEYLATNHKFVEALALLSQRLSRQPDNNLVNQFDTYARAYLELKFGVDKPSKADDCFLFHYSKAVFKPLLDCCGQTKQRDFIFTTCMEYATSKQYTYLAFIDCLVPMILDNKISCVPFEVLKSLKDYLFSSHRYELLERCILKLDIASMDFTEFFDGCWRHQLYDAIFYIFSRGLNDCVAPFKILLPYMHTETGYNMDLGNKILNNMCLFLTDIQHFDYFKEVMKLLCTKYDNPDHKTPWRYIKIILEYDLKNFCNVLTIVFNRMRDIQDIEILEQMKYWRNKIIHVMLQIIFSDKKFATNDISNFFIFIARQISYNKDGILLNKVMLHQIIESLTINDGNNMIEKQQALLGLLESGSLDTVDLDHIASLAKKLNFEMVCIFIFEKQQKYEDLIRYTCYHSERKSQVFDILIRLSLSNKNNNFVKTGLIDIVKDILEILIEIDPSKTAELLRNYFPEILENISTTIKDSVKKYRLYSEFFPIIGSKEIKRLLHDELISEEYLKLICMYEPDKVGDFIANPGSYRDAIALNILEEFQLFLPISVVLERVGRHQEAASVHLKNLQNQINFLMCVQPKEGQVELQTFSDDFGRFISFIRRNFRKITKDELKNSWFTIVNMITSAITRFQEVGEVTAVEPLKAVGNMAVTEMSKQIPMSDIFNLVVNDPSMSTLSLGNIPSMLNLMSENYDFEKSFSLSLVKILAEECNGFISRRAAITAHGASFCRTECTLCEQPLYDVTTTNQQSDDALISWCNHSFHKSCMITKSNGDNVCPKCSHQAFKTVSPREVMVSNIGGMDKASEYFLSMQRNINKLFNATKARGSGPGTAF